MLGRQHRATALQRRTRTSRVDEDPSHDLRSQGEEVHAVLAVHFLCAGKSQIDLVNHCGTLQRQARTLSAHVPLRLPSQLRVDQRHELIERGAITLAPRLEQVRNVNRVGLGHEGNCSTVSRVPHIP